mmetsp:Transcript_63765/g.190247  ORF Transcript_63765/g.190247 Transcript_63765/m.190247 type:complete len:114 (-) Transcript_63765:45-386(-)
MQRASGWRIRGLQPAAQVAARALFAAGGRAPTSAATPIFCAESIGRSRLLPIASSPVVQLAVVRQKEADLVHDEPSLIAASWHPRTFAQPLRMWISSYFPCVFCANSRVFAAN